MDDDGKIPLLLEYLYGEAAEAAQGRASEQLLGDRPVVLDREFSPPSLKIIQYIDIIYTLW